MRPYLFILALALSFQLQTAVADEHATTTPSPLGELQSQIDALAARIEVLENNAPNPSVDGRSYCLLGNVSVLQGFASSGTEVVASQVVRRLFQYSGGSFTGTLVDSDRASLNDNGVVSLGPGVAPPVVSGTYTQSGSRLSLLFSDGTTGTMYVSGDGTTILSNGIGFLGPFPSTLTIGIVRGATQIESNSCDGFPGS